MEDIGTFEILAEVSIGLAGFGSIAVILGQGRREMAPADRFRVLGLYVATLGAMFLALLPIGLAHTRGGQVLLWQLSSAAMIVYIFIAMALILWFRRDLPPEHHGGRVLMGSIGVTTVINAAAQLQNMTGIFHVPGPSPYYFGVIWFLGLGCVFFLRLIFHQPRETGKDS